MNSDCKIDLLPNTGRRLPLAAWLLPITDIHRIRIKSIIRRSPFDIRICGYQGLHIFDNLKIIEIEVESKNQ